MKTTDKIAIKQTLTGINWQFGKGDLGRVNWRAGTVSRTIPITQHARSKPEHFRFKIDGRKVRFLSKTRVWKVSR